MALIDAFAFNGEWDMLALRLRTLDKMVDRFVLVESNKTFRCLPKEYAFESPPDEFRPWLSRIRYIKVDDDCIPGSNGRLVEERQYGGAMIGIDDAADDDIVMLSALDEIPDPARYDSVLDALETHLVVSMAMRMYVFWLNAYRGGWTSVLSAKASTWRAATMSCSRAFREHKTGRSGHRVGTTLPAAVGAGVTSAGAAAHSYGWHFGWMGPWSRIEAKQRDMTEKQWDTPEYRERLRDDYERCQYGFAGAHPLTLHQIDDTFPLPLREHPERWAHIIKSVAASGEQE